MADASLYLLIAASSAGSACRPLQHPAPGVDDRTGPYGPESEHRFSDAERWAKRFEDPKRDAWQRPDEVLKLLSITPEMRIADIGSATGYFPVRFARAAPAGMVYGLEIEPDMVRYLNRRARQAGIDNLRSILAEPDDPKIPEPVDLIFLCNTYHHVGRRVDYFHERRADLRPGGRLAVVDFKPGDLPIGPPPDHKLAPEVVTVELADAGYALITRDESLPYQYVLIFEPTARGNPKP